MKKILFLLLLTCLSFISFSQKENSDEILKEGKLLYRLEKASWYGTDHFLENYKDKADSIGGYLSYLAEGNKVCTIFWNRFDSGHLLIRYYFDSLPGAEPVSFTLGNPISSNESDLIALREDAKTKVMKNTDRFFTFYPNTSYNFIPLITKKERKVFIITGPNKGNDVLIGNDYLLLYNKDNEFIEKRKIHNSLIRLPYKGEKEGDIIQETMHSHVVTELITSTDICTLLLYKDFVEWRNHYVIGKKYVSIFNLDKELLVVMKTKAFLKMYKNE